MNRSAKTTEDILRDLVAMPTVSGDQGAIRKALDYIEMFLKPYDLHIKRHKWNGVESLVATTHDTKTPTVFLAAHVDVVPAPDEMFHLEKTDGKYLGRGVQDMKGALAAFLSVIAELGNNLKDYDLGLFVTSDEEIGGFDGTAKLVEAGYVPRALILPDGGNNWDIEKAAKGFWHFTITAKGQSAHASRPWEGENAIDKVLEAVQGIRALFPSHQSNETNTVNIGRIHGGEAVNQIAADVSVGIDMRFTSRAEKRHIMATVKRITKARGLQLISEVEGEPVVSDPKNHYLKTYARLTGEITGRKPEWIISNGGSDARFFANHDTVCIVSYPPGGNFHGHHEWITQESLGQMHQLFLGYIKEIAKVSAKEAVVAH